MARSPRASSKRRQPPPLDRTQHIGGYHLSDSTRVRRRALQRCIRRLARRKGEAERRSAKRVKARLNVLRIYRRRRDPEGCRLLTRDMRFLDRTYGGGRTRTLCPARTPDKV